MNNHLHVELRIIIINRVIPLAQLKGIADSQGPALQKSGAEKVAAEAETVLVQIGLKNSFGETAISSQDEGFGVTDDDIQSVE